MDPLPKLRDLDLLTLPPRRAYCAWLAAVGLTMREHAQSGGYQQADVSAVTAGKRSSRPILEWLERETGIPVGDWTA